MTGGAAPPPAGPRRTLAAAAGLLLALACAHQLSEARGRASVERFFSGFTLDVRRPEMLATARVEVAADLAKQVAVRAATLDVAGQAPLAHLSPELRETWLRSVRELPEEVAAARALALEALEVRPAWAFHALALAGLVLADEWRTPAAERRVEKWLAPVRLAADWAPALPAPFTTWGGAAVRRWPLLAEADRRAALPVLRRALEEEGFRASSLAAVLRALGTADGLALVPDSPGALAAARRVLGDGAPFEDVAAVEARWRKAEREERRRRAAQVSEALAAGRADRAVDAARELVRLHPLDLFDDAEGREQARLVAEAIGDGRPGSWPTDVRANVVLWLLANPLRRGGALDVRRAVRGLTGVPDGVLALLHLLAGDEAGWRGVERSSDTRGSSEWTPFLLERARRELRAGSVAGAEEALAEASRFDLGGCEALLVRRDVARARRRDAEAAALEEELAAGRARALDLSRRPASEATALTFCVDPAREAESLRLVLAAEGPALLAWGWDGGREDVLRIERRGESDLVVPLSGLGGARTFAVGTVAGAAVRPVRARIETAAPASAPR